MNRRPVAVSQALPSNLRHLQIKPCGRHISLWFPVFATACVNGVFSKLCQVELHFRGSLKDSLIWIDQGRGLLGTMRGVLNLLKDKHGISLRGYNESGICTGDLLEELDAWSYLSPTELWYPTQGDAEFSSIVARTNQGAPRRRSAKEIRAYIKRDILSRESVFTRQHIFNPDVVLQVTAPRSFPTNVEKLPKATTPRFTSSFASWLASVAAAQQVSESAVRSELTHPLLGPTAEKYEGKRSWYIPSRSWYDVSWDAC